MRFAEQSPSSAWERFPLEGDPRQFVWAWFKPEGAPNCLCVQIPDEVLRDSAENGALTLKAVLGALGVDIHAVATGTLFGVPFEGERGASPVLEARLTPPEPAADPTITIYVDEPSFNGAPAADIDENRDRGSNVDSVAPAAESAESRQPQSLHAEVFLRLDFAWNACVQLENAIFSLRQQYSAMLMRINAINRELTADESRCADAVDRRDWQACRQWMRDVLSNLMRTIKVHDVSRQQLADKRGWLESAYYQYVMPRRDFDGVEQIEQEFQAYHAGLQSLLATMNAIRDPAWQGAERKIHHTLSRIAFKMRTNRSVR